MATSRSASADPTPKGRFGMPDPAEPLEPQQPSPDQLKPSLWPRSQAPRLRMQSRGAFENRKRLGGSLTELKLLDDGRPPYLDGLNSDEGSSNEDTPSTACELDDTHSTASRTVENSSAERSRSSRSPCKRRETHPSVSPSRRQFSKSKGGAWEDGARPVNMSPRRRRVLQRYMNFQRLPSEMMQAAEPSDEESEEEGEDACPLVYKIQSEPSPTSRYAKMRAKASMLHFLQEENEGEEEAEEGEPTAGKIRVPAQKRRDSFHTLGSHVSWTSLLEYAGDCPEAWSARKVHRWLGMNEKDAFVFLSDLVDLRNALNNGDQPETQAGPQLQPIETPREWVSKTRSRPSGGGNGWFGWIFGGRSAGRSTVQAAGQDQPGRRSSRQPTVPEEPASPNGGFFSWLLGGYNVAKVPSSVKPMRFIHDDVITYELEKLDEIGLLGRGAFGQVTLVRCGVTGQLLALKAVSKGMLVEMHLQHSVMVEKAVMQATSSLFLVKMAATFNRDDRLYLLLEAVMGGDLYTVYRRFDLFGSEEHARFYAACAALGFEHLHQKRILYRDLKMENLVLDMRGYCKLCDFGTSTFDFDVAYTMCGTPEYMPPEVVCGCGHGPAADWWTLGVLVYEMVMAVTPFAEEEPLQIFAKSKLGIDKVEGFNDIHTPWSDFVRGLCKHDPAKRLPMLEGGVSNVRNQEWFAEVKYDWASLEAGIMKAPHLPTSKGPEDRCNFAGEEQEAPLDLPYLDSGSEWDQGFEDAVGPRFVAGKEP